MYFFMPMIEYIHNKVYNKGFDIGAATKKYDICTMIKGYNISKELSWFAVDKIYILIHCKNKLC